MKTQRTIEEIAVLIFERTHSIDDRGGDYQAECVVATCKILRAAMPMLIDETTDG